MIENRAFFGKIRGRKYKSVSCENCHVGVFGVVHHEFTFEFPKLKFKLADPTWRSKF